MAIISGVKNLDDYKGYFKGKKVLLVGVGAGFSKQNCFYPSTAGNAIVSTVNYLVVKKICNPVKVVFNGGIKNESRQTEATIMKWYLGTCSLAKEVVLDESSKKRTDSNVRSIAKMAIDENVDVVAVVLIPDQLFIARFYLNMMLYGQYLAFVNQQRYNKLVQIKFAYIPAGIEICSDSRNVFCGSYTEDTNQWWMRNTIVFWVWNWLSIFCTIAYYQFKTCEARILKRKEN